MEVQYWDRERETMDRESLEKLQLERLQATVEQALKTVFYKRRLGKIGITSGRDIASLQDIEKIPFTTKNDLREAYPDKLLAVDRDEVVRLHTSSGTTGTPTVIYHTQHDLDSWTDLTARGVTATGATRADVFQNMMTYGLFTGGLGLHYAAERIGMIVIPSSSGNTPRQMKLMRDFQTSVIHATPSYILHIHAKLAEEGYRVEDFNLKKAFIGAEAHSENTRKKIEGLFGMEVYNSYGMSEMNGPGVAFECVCKEDMHIWEDAYLVEMVRPKTADRVPDGEEGELVLTTLQREATPLLRYRSGDLTSLNAAPCACGRSHRRIKRIRGRADDMMIVNGVNMYPSTIESVIMSVPEVGTNYQICIEKQGSLDRLTVRTEIYSKMFTGDIKALEGLKTRIREKLKSAIIISPVVELHEPGALPTYEGKAVRVFDLRDKND
ncbi:MAG: phenylacetate--CoA ligase [Kiritimatiellae bacterium]|nr:phenylacetate--CoA ligase [Kiritimatiellia bacterium]MDD4737011.1 phenylacetate--CoA ligase [Kiritimatiellia bacterium]